MYWILRLTAWPFAVAGEAPGGFVESLQGDDQEPQGEEHPPGRGEGQPQAESDGAGARGGQGEGHQLSLTLGGTTRLKRNSNKITHSTC